jgi:hypothetical protein
MHHKAKKVSYISIPRVYLQFLIKIYHIFKYEWRGRRVRDRMVVGLPWQSVPITTDVVSSNLDQGEVYNIM